MGAVKQYLISIEDMRTERDLYKGYTNYLRAYYAKYVGSMEEDIDPADFNTFCNELANKECLYQAHVTVNDASHTLEMYENLIDIKAPAYLDNTQLKKYIIEDCSMSIEDFVNPRVDAPDAVNVEIYDFDLEIVTSKEL